MVPYRSDRLPVTVVAIATTVVVVALGVPALPAIALGAAILIASTLASLTTHVGWTRVALRLRAELRDPTGPLLALLVALAVFAAGTPILAAIAAGVAILVIKAIAGAMLRAPAPSRPRLQPGSAAASWLDRAERAVDAIGKITPGPRSALANRFAETRDGARDTAGLIRRLGSHELVVSRVLAGIDPRLDQELRRLDAERAAEIRPEIEEEIGRAVLAIKDQIDARDRLRATDRTLVARMQTAALGLEGLVARLGEIAVLSQGGASATANARVDELADELDALRAGLTEADALARITVHELRPENRSVEGSR